MKNLNSRSTQSNDETVYAVKLLDPHSTHNISNLSVDLQSCTHATNPPFSEKSNLSVIFLQMVFFVCNHSKMFKKNELLINTTAPLAGDDTRSKKCGCPAGTVAEAATCLCQTDAGAVSDTTQRKHCSLLIMHCLPQRAQASSA